MIHVPKSVAMLVQQLSKSGIHRAFLLFNLLWCNNELIRSLCLVLIRPFILRCCSICAIAFLQFSGQVRLNFGISPTPATDSHFLTPLCAWWPTTLQEHYLRGTEGYSGRGAMEKLVDELMMCLLQSNLT